MTTAIPVEKSETRPLGLSPREGEVAALVAEGLSDRAIAARLVISRHTVGSHVRAIQRKFGVANRVLVAVLWDRATRGGCAVR